MNSILAVLILVPLVPARNVNFVERNQTDLLAEPTEEDVHFYLYTRLHDVNSPEELELDILSLLQSGFDPSKSTFVLCHGFSSDGIGFGKPFAEAFLQVGDFNVITIDWGKMAMWTDYFGAAARTRFVGQYAANLVGLLADIQGIKQIHLIGHSLGAHVMGFLGKEIKNRGNDKIPRITGLDPAQPSFELALSGARLDKDDADFVDIIHTNSGMLWEGCLSITKAIGHVDFYPGGGKHQPGCLDLCLGGTCTDHDLFDLIKGGCSHGRANLYFIESILVSFQHGPHFKAWKCGSQEEFDRGECCNSDTLHMGFTATGGEAGKYFLNVGKATPYSLEGQGNSAAC